MTEDIKKLIITSSIFLILVALVVTLLFVNVDLGFIHIGSIDQIKLKHNEVLEAESKLTKKETEYKSAVSTVNASKDSFETAKSKYEAISEETINIIKEATTEENYNIEYMWIRLGNYATKNNLTIVMAEPGGSFTSGSTDKESTNKTTKTTTTTTTTTKNDETDTTTNKSSDTTANTNTDSDTNKTTNKETTDKDTLFKIQVTGSYMDVSDFVFEVENDNALRFKLDNISMDYVSGTTIKATFNVKNLIINK